MVLLRGESVRYSNMDSKWRESLKNPFTTSPMLVLEFLNIQDKINVSLQLIPPECSQLLCSAVLINFFSLIRVHDQKGGEGGVFQMITLDHKGGVGKSKGPKTYHEILEQPLILCWNKNMENGKCSTHSCGF